MSLFIVCVGRGGGLALEDFGCVARKFTQSLTRFCKILFLYLTPALSPPPPPPAFPHWQFTGSQCSFLSPNTLLMTTDPIRSPWKIRDPLSPPPPSLPGHEEQLVPKLGTNFTDHAWSITYIYTIKISFDNYPPTCLEKNFVRYTRQHLSKKTLAVDWPKPFRI